MLYLRAYIAAALLCAASFCVADARTGEIARLPSSAAPVSYDLSVHPDVKSWTTSGEETIVVRLSSPADHVALNWRGTSVTDASIDGVPAAIALHSKIQQVWFSPQVRLQAGLHRLSLRFTSAILGWTGKGGDQATGGFFQTGDPVKAPFLVTMFEPSRARRLFPCFDEPQFRAPITLHVTAPAQWTVVSNMPGTRALQGPSAIWDFAPTPAMPVYLLTLDAGQMSSIEGSSDGIALRVFASSAYAVKHPEVMQRVLSDGERSLHFYDSYFGVRYPLPKLDLVIAPTGFYTALEQWGAITFYDPAVVAGAMDDPAASLREGAGAIAHEIAHQWFGDLVGMRWWSDIFVAEGLAQFAQERAEPNIDPAQTWWIDDDSLADSVMKQGMTAKMLAAGNMHIATDYDADDNGAFSDAAYYKFAAVVRMWELYIGEARFRSGLTAYLRSNAGRAVGTDDFWNAFHDARAVPFGNAWLKHPGFPVISMSSTCSGGRRILAFSQQPFTDGRGAPPGYAQQLWPVPIFVTQDATTVKLLLEKRSMRASLGRCGDPVTIDAGFRPYYRLRYAGSAFGGYARALQGEGERDRANAARDALQLFKAHDAPAGYLFDVLADSHVNDPLLQHDIGIALSGLLDQTPHGPEHDAVAALVRRLAEPIAESQLAARAPSTGGAWTMTLALMQAGDPKIAPQAWRYLQSFPGGNIPWTDASWAFAALAASSADSSTVAQMEKRVRFPAPASTGFPIQIFYLEHVTKPDLVRGILRYYHGEPGIVFALARTDPQLVWAYLQENAAQVRGHGPPSQQGWMLSQGVAGTLWDVAPPAQMRAFLERSLGPQYRGDIDAAMAEAARRREVGSALAAEIDRWLLTQRKSPVTLRRMSTLHGKGGPNRGAGLPHRHRRTSSTRQSGDAGTRASNQARALRAPDGRRR